MSIHPSLSQPDKGKQHRGVLKRFERIKMLLEKDKWKEGDSVFGLPKIKIIKVKIKKEKAQEEKPAEGQAPAGAAAAPETPAKTQKEQAGKKEPMEAKKEAKKKE